MIKTDVGQSTIFLFLEYFLKLCLGFLVSALITRQLGPVDSGKLSYVLSFSTMFIPLYIMGINEFTVKDFVEQPDHHAEIFGTSFILKLVGSFLAILLTVGSFFLFKIQKELQLFIFLNSLFLSFKSFEVIDNWFLSKIRSKEISIARNLILIFSSSVKIIFWLQKREWYYFILISLAEPMLYGFNYIYLYKKSGFKVSEWKFDISFAKRYIKNSFSFLVLTLFSTLLFKIDQIYVEKHMGAETLGHYLAAVKLIEIWQFAPMVIISVIFPKLVSSFENKEVFQQKKLTYYSFITIPSFLFCILVSLIASPLIHILYGAAFEHSATFLAKYNWVVLLLYFWWARMRISIIQQKIIDEIIVAVAALIIMILSLFLFSSYLGQYITIFSLLFSLISGNLIGAIFSNHIKESLKDFIFSFNVKQLLNPNF